MDFLGSVFPIVLQSAKYLADTFVAGEKLGRDAKQTLYSAYVILSVHGDEIVENTLNTYDDEGVAALKDFCADTLSEAGITVPVIPEELLEAPPEGEDNATE